MAFSPQATCELQKQSFAPGAGEVIVFRVGEYWQCDWCTAQEGCPGAGTIIPTTILPRCYDTEENDYATGYTIVEPGVCMEYAEEPRTCTPDKPVLQEANPVLVSTGTKVETATDFSTADGLLQVGRHYRSDYGLDRTGVSIVYETLGIGWRSSFGWQLQLRQGFRFFPWFQITDPNGSTYFYQLNSSIGTVTSRGTHSELYTVELDEPVNHPVRFDGGTFHLTMPDNTRVTFELFKLSGSSTYTEGRVTQIRKPSGYTQTFSYQTESARILSSVTDSFGRELRFTWKEVTVPGQSYSTPKAIERIDLPDGTSLHYSYGQFNPDDPYRDVADKLLKVERKAADDMVLDSTTYHYEDTRLRHALTGITGHDSVRYATFTYDENGRVTVSEHAGSAERTTFSYAETGNDLYRTTVTNALGKTASYNFRDVGIFRIEEIEGEASANCAASERLFGYDAAAPSTFVETTDEEGRITKYERDDRGRPTKITRAFGTADEHVTEIAWAAGHNGALQIRTPNLQTDYTYDAYGLLTETTRTDTTSHTQPYATSGESRSWSYSYTPEGRLASVDGPLDGTSDTVTFAYDGNFDLSSVTDELGHQTKVLSVNGRGQPTSIEDANGLRTDLAYDRLGRLSDVTLDPFGLAARTEIAYDAIGQVTQITRFDGSLLRYTYDEARRLTSVENGLGERIEFAHDLMGNITGRTIKAADSRIVFAENRTYDELGRLLTSVGAGPRIWRHAYNRLGETTSITDPRDRSWRYAYDSLGRLIAETDPDNGGIQRAYDGDDNLALYDDQNGVVTTFLHNGFGEVIEENSPDAGAVVYHRDNRGLITRRTDGRGVVKTYSYDVAGRLTAVSYPGSPDENVTLTYDSTAFDNKGVGRLTGWTDEGGATGYVYDLLGRVISETRTIAGHSHTVAYTYDTHGNILTLTYPSGRVVAYEREMEGLVSAVATRASTTSEELVLAASVAWNPFGEISRIVYGNGLTLNKSFTTNYDLSAMELLEPIDGYNLFDRVYSYEDTLNLTRIDDNLSNRYSETYTYDALNRLQSADGVHGSRQYGYDGVGNRTSRTLVSDGSTTTEELFRELNSNRLQTVNVNGMTARSFTYDGAGNMLTDAGSAGTTGYSYNHAGRLQSVTLGGVTTGTYTYNALGQLVSRTKQNITPSGTAHYIHDLNGNLIAETDGNGNTVREYVWIEHRGTKSAPQATGAATPLAVVAGVDTASPAAYLVHGDHLERPVMMTAAIRPPVSHAYIHWFAAYTPFGTLQQTMGVIDTDNRFPGQWYQLESGLHYNWHRHYDPTLGRYTQPDPLGLIDGPSRYAYARNNPTQLLDPKGEFAQGVGSALAYGGAIIAGLLIYKHWLDRNPDLCLIPPGLPNTNDNKPGIGHNGGPPLNKNDGNENDGDGKPPTPPGPPVLPSDNMGGNDTDSNLPQYSGDLSYSSKVATQMKKRGWTEKMVREALITEGIPATGKNGPATRYVHPTTGNSVIKDNATGEIFHVGGTGYLYD
ncbi:RHS repeat-associated core domain-containing protein [Roseibium sp. MMSF_3412]|uniref:RHS repeat-associated core domain-containing protein n=1 Tax=Roseibium sp. MMSF_3412 TaxID=3046712 RepID=UPI00273E965D|nr:RHS repeat-associated core domain-containing protein [Roseibium sp. MMSF_3412]